MHIKSHLKKTSTKMSIEEKLDEIHSMLSKLTRPEEVMTKPEVAGLLKCAKKTVDDYERKGMIKRINPLGHPKYRRSEVLIILKANNKK